MEKEVVELTLGDKLLAWFETHRKETLYGAVGIVVLGFIIGVVIWRQGEKRVQASLALSRVEAGFAAQRLAPGATDLQKQAADRAAAYLKIASEHSGTPAAARAMLQAASELFIQQKYGEAQAQFEKFTRENSGSPFIPQALLGVAASLEAQGKKTEAMHAYEALVKSHPTSTVAPQAEFSLARIYQAEGREQQAWSTYEKLAQMLGPSSSIGSESGILAEELKAKNPGFGLMELPPPGLTSLTSSLTNNTPASTTNP
jgi:tetratricopeptide (TPR) repeat protein